MKKRRPFRFKQFEVTQEGGCMPVTTDACIFGALADIGNAKSVLDIGTGTGLLSLLLAQRFPEANFTAIDIDEESIRQAKINFNNSPWNNRITSVITDIRHWNSEIKYDAVVCNPPFFDKQLPSKNEIKRRSRHTVSLNFAALLTKIKELLHPEGKCCLLIPRLHSDYVIEILNELNLYVKDKIQLRSFAFSEPHVVIICLSSINSAEAISDFIIYREPGIYSEKMTALMKNYYL